jgi:glycosyltransferase involved in cell wall biosynthesis
MSASLLILSYVFPPYPGIGGRRWAKFAKYLAQMGYPVQAIAARNPFPAQSNWTKDVEGLPVRYLPGRFPEIFGHSSISGFLPKLRYRLALSASRLRTRGNYFDRAAFWKADLLKAAEEVIQQQGITHIMATGAPFHLLHHALELKRRHPQIRLLCDFRDPWTDGEYLFGMNSLSTQRLERERQMEQEVLSSADVITSVSDAIVKQLKAKAPDSAARFETLINGFDPADFQSLGQQAQDDAKIRFVLTGSLYPELEYIFLPLLDALQALRQESPEWGERLLFQFYGQADPAYERHVKAKGLEDQVQFFPPVPLEEVGGLLHQAAFTLLFLNQHLAFSRSTKFYEYLAAGKKIVVFSAPGETQAYVEAQGIGYAVTPENMKERLLFLAGEALAGRTQPNPDYDISAFSIPGLTRRLLSLLEIPELVRPAL